MADYTVNITAKATGLDQIEARINKLKQQVTIPIDASGATASLSALHTQLKQIKLTAGAIKIGGTGAGGGGFAGFFGGTGSGGTYNPVNVTRNVNKTLEKLNNRTYENQLDKARKTYAQLTDLSTEHRQAAEMSMKKMESAYSTMMTKTYNKAKQQQAGRVFEDSAKQMQNLSDMARRSGNYFADPKQLASAQAQIAKILDQNPRLNRFKNAAGQTFKEVGENIQKSLNVDEISKGNLNQAMTQISQLKKDIVVNRAGGNTWLGETANAFKRIGTFALTYGGIQKGIQAVSKSVNELKQVDTILTEISKTSMLEGRQLQMIGEESFGKASKYGRTAQDYLYGVQEMSRAGFYGESAKQLSELSLMAQAAGDLTADQANDYILASNAAFKYGGNVEKLNNLLDGQNMIADRNAVSMQDMQAATQKAASVAETFGVREEELSALIGTATARTRLSGDVTGRALRSILINLENINNSKIVKTLQAAGVSQTTMEDGVEKARSAIDILTDLQIAYDNLDEGSTLRNEILTNIGGKNFANTLAAMLEGWDDYEKMLEDFASGSGSAQREADKSANNWQGTLNKLSNSFTSFVSNFANSGFIINGLKGINAFVTGLDKAVSILGGFSTTLIGLNIFNGRKGIANIFSEFKTNGLTAGLQMTGASLGAWFKSIPGMATTAITAISAVYGILDNLDKRRESANLAIIENAKQSVSNQADVMEAYAAYSDLVDSGSTDTNALADATANLESALSNAGSSFDAAATSASGYASAVQEAVSATTQETLLEAKRAQNAAYENMGGSLPGLFKSLFSDSWDMYNPNDIISKGARRSEILGSESGALDAISDYYSQLDRLDELTELDQLKSSEGKSIQKYINNNREYMKAAVEATRNAAMLEYEANVLHGVAPQTVAQYDNMVKYVLDAFKDSTGNVNEDLSKELTSYLAKSFPELNKESIALKQAANESAYNIQQQFIDALKDEHGDYDTDVANWFTNLSTKAMQRSARQIQADSTNTIFSPENWGVTEWQHQLDYMTQYGESQAASLEKFRNLLAGGSEEEPDEWYSDIQNSVSQIQDLQSVLDDLDAGGFKSLDKMGLIEKFPELAGYTSDLETLQSRIRDLQSVTKENMMQDFAIQLDAMGVEGNVAREALEALANEIDLMTDLDFTFDINAEISKFEALGNAMKESVSGTGLTDSTINQLEAMYGGLDGYDPATFFEKTANGVRMSTSEMRKLQSAYEATKSVELAQDITKANEAYERQASILGQMQQNGGYSSQQLAAQQGLVDQLKSQADAAAMAAAQFDGLTSAFNKYQQAISGGDQRDQLEAMSNGYEATQKLIDQGWGGSDDVFAYVDYWKGLEDNAGVDDVIAGFQSLDEQIENTSYSLHDLMTFDDNGNMTADGVHRFFDALSQIEEATGQSFSKITEDGQKIWDFTDGGESKIADLMGTTTEAVEGFIAAAQDAGYDIKFDVNTSNLDQARTMLSSLNDAQLTDIKVQLGLSEEAGIDQILGALQETNATITVNADGSLAVSQIQSDVDGVETTVVADGDGTKAKAEIQADVAGIQSTVDATGTATITYNQGTQPTVTNQNVTVDYSLGNQAPPEDKTAKVNYELGTSPTTVPSASGTANFSLGSYPTSLPPIHQWVYQHVVKLGGSTTWTGTAHAMGTAKARGDWSVGSNQTALMAELGRELVVSVLATLRIKRMQTIY